MKAFIISSSLAAAVLIAGGLSDPSFAQTQSNQQNQPGTGGTSKPGVQGLPGSKSGPASGPAAGTNAEPAPSTQRAATPIPEQTSGQRTGGQTNSPMPNQTNNQANPTLNQDQSKVPGMPGNKSGSAIKE